MAKRCHCKWEPLKDFFEENQLEFYRCRRCHVLKIKDYINKETAYLKFPAMKAYRTVKMK